MFEIKVKTICPPPEIPGYRFTGEIRFPKQNEYLLPLHNLVKKSTYSWTQLLIKDNGICLNLLGLIYEPDRSIDFNNMYYKIFDECKQEIFRISVCEIYGKTSKELNLSIPPNYEVINFRIPRENDIVLFNDLDVGNICNEKMVLKNVGSISLKPRLILRDLKER